MSGYGIPQNLNDASPRGGSLAPNINALSIAVDDLDARLIAVKTTADAAKSEADTAKSTNDSQATTITNNGKSITALDGRVTKLENSPVISVPFGGRAGEVLKKASNADGDLEWSADIMGGGGTGGGAGLPAGGIGGQVLTKKSAGANDADWETPPPALPAGGTAGQVLTKNSATAGDASWLKATGGHQIINPATGQPTTQRDKLGFTGAWAPSVLDIGDTTFLSFPKQLTGAGVVGTVVDYNGALNTATVSYTDDSGATVIATFARNASAFSLSTNDTVGLILPGTSTGPVIVAGIIAHSSGYNAPVQGPFNVISGWPVNQSQTDILSSISGRDNGNILGYGVDTLVGLANGGKFYNPRTGVSGSLPPLSGGSEPFFAVGKMFSVLGNANLYYFDPVQQAWLLVAPPAVGNSYAVLLKSFVHSGKPTLVRYTLTGSSVTFYVSYYDGSAWSTFTTQPLTVTSTSAFTANPNVMIGSGKLWLAYGNGTYAGELTCCDLTAGNWTRNGATGSYATMWSGTSASRLSAIMSDGSLWMIGRFNTSNLWVTTDSDAIYLTKFTPSGGRSNSQWISAKNSGDGSPYVYNAASSLATSLTMVSRGGTTPLIGGAVNITTYNGSSGTWGAACIWATDGTTTSRVFTANTLGWGVDVIPSGGSIYQVTVTPIISAPESAGRFIWLAVDPNTSPTRYSIYDGTL